jgi:hypothetical protein
MKEITPTSIQYDEKGHRHMKFKPGELEKYVEANLGTNAPVVNSSGELIGILPTDVIWKCLCSVDAKV